MLNYTKKALEMAYPDSIVVTSGDHLPGCKAMEALTGITGCSVIEDEAKVTRTNTFTVLLRGLPVERIRAIINQARVVGSISDDNFGLTWEWTSGSHDAAADNFLAAKQDQ